MPGAARGQRIAVDVEFDVAAEDVADGMGAANAARRCALARSAAVSSMMRRPGSRISPVNSSAVWRS